MKRLIVLGVFAITLVGLAVRWTSIRELAAQVEEAIYGDPDMGPFDSGMSKEDFMLQRSEGIALRRGISKDQEFDPQQRISAIKDMDQQELSRINLPESDKKNVLLSAWTEIGPNPIPNGQVVGGTLTAVSGRTIAIAIHPTNPNIVYVGTAQGGLYRTTDGGTTWTPLMDNALSLAVGAVAISPSQPDTIYVGTGEPNFSADSFFGVGVYRIDNASTTNPTITGPLNKDGFNADIFTGRAIGRIIVHPTDPATIFVASNTGIGGIGGTTNNVLPSRGIYRSTNATSASPTFTKLTGLSGNVNASVRDIISDPLNPNLLVANSVQSGGLGGIYVSTDALSANPTFAQRVIFNSTLTSELTAEFAVHHISGPNPTIYAATGNLGGRILINTDGGTTWTQQIDNDFCSPQCFYNIAVDVDPTNVNRLYLGGTGNATTLAISTNGGTSFTSSAIGLHTDSHVVKVAPSNPATVYFGSDGGIYKSTDSGANWTSLNNSTFKATQFMSIAVHPIDPNFTIGGTQDNGTNYFDLTGAWTRADSGDGGYSVIDQNALDSTNVRMYHTYFNSLSSPLVGYATRATTSAGWTFRGCNGGPANNISCTDTAVLFYAPLEQGPGNPNTVYYGSDRLYRSADAGTSHTVVSQSPIESGIALSSIGISPQNDNIRIVGLSNGGLYGTTTGSSTLTNLDASNVVPNNYIARSVIDPTNVEKAYITLSAFGVTNVWKTSNLSNANPTWISAASGLPQVPVNGFVVDPTDSTKLYAGTDIGVYTSTDSGANWLPLGTGLPRVAVFDMAIAPGRVLRIATHGRGMWQINLAASGPVTVSGRATTSNGTTGLRNATVSMTGPGNVVRTTTTSSFGFFSFDNVTPNQQYTFRVQSRLYRYTPVPITITDNITLPDLVGQE